MKIGFFTDGYLPQINGVATSTDELASSLRKRKNKIVVVAPSYPNYKDVSRDVLRLKSFKLFKNPELRISYMFPDKILREVISKDFDIIHGFSGGSVPSLGLFLAKLKRKPYVFTYNTRFNQYAHYILNGKIVKPKAIEAAVSVFCNRCTMIVAPTEFVKEELISFGIKRPIKVIPNGVDINKFKKIETSALRDEFGLRKNDKIALYLGRLAKEKSVDFILKSFALVSKKERNIHLFIAGDGPEKKALEKLTQDLGINDRVIFLGFVNYEDVPKIYSEADLYVFASETETQGMVILEAMSCGLPVLTIKDEVFENIITDQKDGFIVEKTEEEFGKNLVKILKDDMLRNKISIAARKNAEKYSLDEIAEKFENLYKELI